MTKKRRRRKKLKMVLATKADVPVLTDMLMESHKDPMFSEIAETKRDAAAEWFSSLVEAGSIILAVKGDKAVGALALGLFPLFYSPDKKVCNSFFWYVDKEHRGNGVGEKLMSEGERAAKEFGADIMLFTVRKDVPQAGGCCVNNGYKLAESQYWKRL